MLQSTKRQMKRGAWVSLAAVVLVAAVAQAKVERVGESETVFHGTGPGGFKLEGKANELTLADDGETLTVTVPLKGLATGIALRDRHMREKYLEVEKYPNAELKVAWKDLKLPEPGATSEGQAKGTMSLHGQIREVPFNYRIVRTASGYEVTGNAALNIKDFGISVPSYLGITVKPDIRVETRFNAKDA